MFTFQGVQAHNTLCKLVQVVAPGYLTLPTRTDGPRKLVVICAHLTVAPGIDNGWLALECVQDEALQQGWEEVCVLVSVPSSQRAVLSRVCLALGGAIKWQEICHRNLGGLTTAGLSVGWFGLNGQPQQVKPGQHRAPVWPLDRFLEPAVPLPRWRGRGSETTQGSSSCW